MRTVSLILMLALVAPSLTHAQLVAQSPEVWRDFARRIAVGSQLKLELVDGTRFNATLVRVDDTGLMVQPKTRVVVPVQPVAYDAISSLEPVKRSGLNKAVAIGVGVGVAAFWGMMIAVFAAFSD